MQELDLKGINKDYQSNEAYKILRTNIEFSGADNKVIVVTSSMPNEGKSTVSLSVAMSLAESGKRVLFIDCDLRKSAMVGRHRVNRQIKGLSHFLSGQAEIGEVLYKVNGETMDMIFAGVVPPNPAELLSQSRFEDMISSARNRYDYVIIDTPPLGSVIDAAIIARQCDTSVLVVAANTVSHKFAKSVKEQLEKSGCPILGAVLNKVDLKTNKYYGRYYGKYE